MGKHHGKHGKSGLGKVLGIAGFAAGFAFPGAFLGAAAGTTGAVRLSAALMGLSLGTTIGSAFAKQSQDMPASNFDNKMNVVDQNAMIPVVYGTRKIGGLQSYHNTSIKNKSLTKDIILGEGQFSGCYGITANGYSVNSNVGGAVFGITNTSASNAYVRVFGGRLEFDTNGVSSSMLDKIEHWNPLLHIFAHEIIKKDGGYREIVLQSSDDMRDDESNDFQCSMAKLYQYIEGIRYDNDLARLGWKLVNPIVVDDAPKHLNNTSWVNVGKGQTAWFYMNHEETKGSYITFHDGTQKPPSYYMKTGSYPNMAYIHAYLKYTDQLGSGNPTITCVAKGRKVYDTRTKKWDYSENPAMIIRDYLINTTFGSGRYINQTMIDEDSFKDAADYCDEMVTSYDTQGRTITEPRYRLNIVINSKRSYLENLQSMLACCAGYLVFTKGQVAMRIERADNPVYAFDDDNIIQNSMSYTAASSTESPNKLNMKYIEPTLDWTSVSAIVEDLVDQKQQPVGRGKIVEKDVELIGVTSQCQALRLGKVYRDLIRLCPISIEFKTAMQALNLEPGDVVTISHNVVLEDNKVQPLFKDMPVRITEIRDDSGTYTIKAQQYNASIYDDRMGGSIKDFDYTTVKKPEDLLPKAVPNVENLNAYTIYKQGRDGVANYDLVVTYDLPSGYLLETGMVYYKCNEGYDLSTLGVIPEGVTGAEVGFANDWKFAGEGPSRLVIPNVHIGVTYKLLVQARNKSGDKAPMIDCPIITITVEKKTTVPNKPDGLSIKYTDVATVSWEDVTNSDIDYYEVRTNKDTGKDEGLLARTSDTSVIVPLASRTGTIYVFGHNTSKLYGYPAVLEYSKALPPKPHAPTVVSKLGALGITTDTILSDCSGVKIHINHDTITSTNNTIQYPCGAGIYNVSYGFYDLFGEGPVSDETSVVVKVLVDQKLLEDGAVSMDKVDETVTKAIEDASNNYKEDLSSVSSDLSATKADLNKTKTDLNTVSSNLSTKSKELSDEITGVKQDITGLTSTVNDNAGNITQLQQRATDIETTVADNKENLSSQIQQNANSISSVVANLNSTDLAKSPYKSITELKQTTDSISSTVSDYKSYTNEYISKVSQKADSIQATIEGNLNSTDTANSPYEAITQLQANINGVSSTVASNKSDTDSSISQVSQKADSIKATIEANLNSTDTANSSYKAITQLQANINGVSSVVSANKSDTDTAISQVSQKADSISSTVSANKTAQDDINSSLTSKIQQNADSITSVVTNLSDPDKAKENYSAISQMQDDINLRVEKGDVISQINLDKTGATIDGKLVHITGDTVIEKNVIAKGMIQAGAVTTDNLAAETISLTDKLKIQGGAVTLDENGMIVKEEGGSSVQFGQSGMSFIDSNGHTFAGIGRFCTGIVNDGQTVKFANSWDVIPSVFLFPIRLQTSAVGYTNINMYQDVEAINVSEEGFTAVCKSILKAGSGANIPLSWECKASGKTDNDGIERYTYNIEVPTTATHIWIAGEASATRLHHYYNHGSSFSDYQAIDVTSVTLSTNTGVKQEHPNYVSGKEGTIVGERSTNTYYRAVKAFTFDMPLSNVSTVTVTFSIQGHTGGQASPFFSTSGGKLTSYRTNLDGDVTVCQGTAGFIAIDPNTVSYTVS